MHNILHSSFFFAPNENQDIYYSHSLFTGNLCLRPGSQSQTIYNASVLRLSWQRTHHLNFGLQPMLLLDAKRDHSNLGLLIAGDLMYYKGAVYFTPVTKLRLMPHKRKLFVHWAWFASVGHSYTQIQKKYDHRITPELGIKWEFLNLSFGYNIPVTYRDNCTNSFRVAFCFNLF